MSKWRKALKNNRRFDARYFLNERVENEEIVENSAQQEEVKRNFHDFSLDSWLTEAEEAIDEAHCGSDKRDDDLEEGQKSDIEELQVHPHTAKDFSGATVPITDEEPPVKKKKSKKGPVDYDPPMGLEESEIEEG